MIGSFGFYGLSIILDFVGIPWQTFRSELHSLQNNTRTTKPKSILKVLGRTIEMRKNKNILILLICCMTLSCSQDGDAEIPCQCPPPAPIWFDLRLVADGDQPLFDEHSNSALKKITLTSFQGIPIALEKEVVDDDLYLSFFPEKDVIRYVLELNDQTIRLSIGLQEVPDPEKECCVVFVVQNLFADDVEICDMCSELDIVTIVVG